MRVFVRSDSYILSHTFCAAARFEVRICIERPLCMIGLYTVGGRALFHAPRGLHAGIKLKNQSDAKCMTGTMLNAVDRAERTRMCCADQLGGNCTPRSPCFNGV